MCISRFFMELRVLWGPFIFPPLLPLSPSHKLKHPPTVANAGTQHKRDWFYRAIMTTNAHTLTHKQLKSCSALHPECTLCIFMHTYEGHFTLLYSLSLYSSLTLVYSLSLSLSISRCVFEYVCLSLSDRGCFKSHIHFLCHHSIIFVINACTQCINCLFNTFVWLIIFSLFLWDIFF